MSRSLAREFALQLLYQLDAYPDDAEEQIDAFLIERLGAGPSQNYLEKQRAYTASGKDMVPVDREPTKAPRVYRRILRNKKEQDQDQGTELPPEPLKPAWDPYFPISDDEDKQAKINEKDRSFIRDLATSVHAERPALDLLYAPFLKSWTPSRLPRTDRSILRIATYEIYYSDDMPIPAAINEAVELAKRFAGKEAPSYINAVLGRMIQEQPIPPQDE